MIQVIRSQNILRFKLLVWLEICHLRSKDSWSETRLQWEKRENDVLSAGGRPHKHGHQGFATVVRNGGEEPLLRLRSVNAAAEAEQWMVGNHQCSHSSAAAAAAAATSASLHLNYQTTRIFMIFAWKVNKILEFCMTFARKLPEFYMLIDGKIYISRIFGGTCSPAPSPVSYAYDTLHRLFGINFTNLSSPPSTSPPQNSSSLCKS